MQGGYLTPDVRGATLAPDSMHYTGGVLEYQQRMARRKPEVRATGGQPARAEGCGRLRGRRRILRRQGVRHEDAPKNLSLEDFGRNRYAHARGARVYVTHDVLSRNNNGHREYGSARWPAPVWMRLVTTDIGVLMTAHEHDPELELHVYQRGGRHELRCRQRAVRPRRGARRARPRDGSSCETCPRQHSRRHGRRMLCTRLVHGVLRTLPDLQLSDRSRRQPRRMRAAVPLEVLAGRGEASPASTCPSRPKRARTCSTRRTCA